VRRHRLFKRMPTGESLRQYRFLKPFAPYLDRHFLWQSNRRTVAGGLAVGLFFGILSPFAQILLAAIGAIVLRVNLPVAAFATLLTNPLTVPPLYYAAYRIGNFFTASDAGIKDLADSGTAQSYYGQLSDVLRSFPLFIEWALSFGLPLMLGLAIIATVSAVLGYFTVSLLWQLSVRLRWSKRRQRQP
jgi:uncharacterized protein (DUF2062 family)